MQCFVRISRMGKPTPGIPLEKFKEEAPHLVERLYRLDYIKQNAMRSKLLLLPSGLNTQEVVDLVKEHCKDMYANFSWIEPAITKIGEKENDAN